MEDRCVKEFFLGDPDLPQQLQAHFGEYRILSLHYRDPQLAREMARAIASSELADQPMLIDADGTLLQLIASCSDWKRIPLETGSTSSRREEERG